MEKKETIKPNIEKRVDKIISHVGAYIQNKKSFHVYTTSYHKIVVFGDELSDIGRWGLHTKWLFPPASLGFYKGRWSNGKLWIDLLSEIMGIPISTTDNYAIAGATSGLTNLYGDIRTSLRINQTIHIDGLLNQVNRYIASQPVISPTTLYVLMGGSNDIISNIRYGTPDIKNETVANNISSAVQLLSNIGCKNFLIANLFDLSTSPAFTNDDQTRKIKNFCNDNNYGIHTLINEYLNSELNIKCLDLMGLFNAIAQDPEGYGFSYQDAYLPLDIIDYEIPVKEPEHHLLHQANGMLADQFMFWWSFCPSAPMHRLIADEAFRLYRNT